MVSHGHVLSGTSNYTSTASVLVSSSTLSNGVVSRQRGNDSVGV